MNNNIKQYPIQLKHHITRWIALRIIRQSDLFNEEYYRKAAGLKPDIDAVAHFYDGGWRVADPSLRFCSKDYLAANPDVLDVNICPLYHYLRYGRREKRRLSPGAAMNRYHRYAVIRGIKRKYYEVYYHGLIRKNKDAKILVVLHLFYEDSCKEIIEYLKNLRKYNYDLVITTVEGRDAEYIGKLFRTIKEDAEIIVFPNRGFDIASYLEVIRKKREVKYDIVMKVQSKRHFEKTGVVAASMYVRGRDWFLYLFESVLGANYVHLNIDRLRNNASTELIAAKNLLMQDPPHKKRMTFNKIEKLGLTLPEDYVFVAGTCFAMKWSTAMEKHLTPLTIADYEKAERYHFSTAHAMERYLTGCVPREAQRGNVVCRMRLLLNEIKGKERLKRRGLCMLDKEDIILDDDFILRFLEGAEVFGYEKLLMPVKDLYIHLDGQRIPLDHCAPYLYLKGEKEQYYRYCLKHRKTDYMELSTEEFEKEIKRSKDARFLQLIKYLDQNGYNESQPVVVCRDGQILDGQHRACWYMHRFGKDSLISVLHLQIDPPK